jgi:hypothetical protein
LPKRQLLFNDQLFQVRKNQGNNPLRRFVSDKEYLKIFVRAAVGENFNVPTFCVIRSKEELFNYEFPARCVIKPTHASGMVEFRRAGEELPLETLSTWFDKDFYKQTRERNYLGLQPKLIVEPFIFDRVPEDYKFFCYNGSVNVLQVDFDRSNLHKRAFFDSLGNQLPFSIKYPQYCSEFFLPTNFDQMRTIAERLSKPFDFVRVDLYSDGDSIMVGEITNCHGGASEQFFPPTAEAQFSHLFFSNEPSS